MYVYSYFERGCRESARYNPERHCGWFSVLFFPRNLKELAGKAMEMCLRAKGKQQK